MAVILSAEKIDTCATDWVRERQVDVEALQELDGLIGEMRGYLDALKLQAHRLQNRLILKGRGDSPVVEYLQSFADLADETRTRAKNLTNR